MESSTYPDKKVVEKAKLFVCVVAHDGRGHGTKEVVSGREKRAVCKTYPTITCDDHEKMRETSGRLFPDINAVPATVFCDPEGKELFREIGGKSAGELTKLMDKALEQVPGPKISSDLWQLAESGIAEGDRLLAEGEYAKAIASYQKVGKLKHKPLVEMADGGLGRANEKGNELIQEATGKAEEGDVKEARALLQKVQRDFRGLDCSKDAAQKLKELKEEKEE